MQPVEQALTTQTWGDPWQVPATEAEHRNLKVVAGPECTGDILRIDIDHRELQAQSTEIQLSQARLQTLTETTASTAVQHQLSTWLISHGSIGNRIASTWRERGASQQALDGEPAATPGSMLLDRFEPVGTAGGNKAAARPHQRGHKPAIEANQGQQQLSQSGIDGSGRSGEKACRYSG